MTLAGAASGADLPLRAHVLRTLRLAGPVMLARAGLPVMVSVDTIMCGRFGPQDLAFYGIALAPHRGQREHDHDAEAETDPARPGQARPVAVLHGSSGRIARIYTEDAAVVVIAAPGLGPRRLDPARRRQPGHHDRGAARRG